MTVKWSVTRGPPGTVPVLTFPTAASPSNTSLTLLLGFAVVAAAALDISQVEPIRPDVLL